jgi:hypothetical protein
MGWECSTLEMKMHTNFWSENLKVHYLGDLDVGEGIILKETSQKQSVRMWNGYTWLSIGTSGGFS